MKIIPMSITLLAFLIMAPALMAAEPPAKVAPDAGKKCSVGSECTTGYCIVQSALCDGKEVNDPRWEKYTRCESFEGKCWGDSFAPAGCQLYLTGPNRAEGGCSLR